MSPNAIYYTWESNIYFQFGIRNFYNTNTFADSVRNLKGSFKLIGKIKGKKFVSLRLNRDFTVNHIMPESKNKSNISTY